jgi:hypothetical protein
MLSPSRLLVAALLPAALFGQRPAPDATQVPTRTGIVPVAGWADAANAPALPPPPKLVTDTFGPKHMPPLGIDPSRAPALQPGAPTTPGGVAAPMGGALVLNDNHAVAPAGAQMSQILEPAAAMHRDTALYTGNWFAATSRDAGRNWTYLNPYTAFPASDGGFCCDQTVTYVPGDDNTCMFIWTLQYSYSAATQQGRHRIAVAVGRERLRQGQFHYYDISPGLLGFPTTNRWLDFPHASVSNEWFYLATNVFDQNSTFQGTGVIRVHLAEMRAAAASPFAVATTPNTETGSNRLSTGATNVMFYGKHWRDIFGAPMIRIFSWDDANNSPVFRDRLVSAWYAGTSTSTGPDGRNWLAGDDHRIQGCYHASGAVSFMWSSAAGGNFTAPFVRIAGFSPANNSYNIVGEASIWHPSLAWAYPSVASNAAGNVGGTLCYGGGGNHPGSVAYVVDAQSGWEPTTNTVVVGGNRGPSARWGDYLWTTRHPQYPNTYLGTAYALDANGNSQPRFAWFGRQNDMPQLLPVSVTSIPVSGAAISVDVQDRNGAQNGATPFTRSYSGVQGMTWTAAAQVVSGGNTYDFERWRYDGTTLAPVGQRDLVISDLSRLTSLAFEARYVRRRHTVSVNSTFVVGVPVTVSPADVVGRTSGTTPTNFVFEDGVPFVVTAPQTSGNGMFDHWIADGVPQPVGQLSLPRTARGNQTLTAAYHQLTCGRITPFGASCRMRAQFGGNHYAITANGTCRPFPGDQVTFGIAGGYSFGQGYVSLALAAFPAGIPIPGNPGCSLWIDTLLSVPVVLDLTGAGTISLTLPNNPGLAGLHLYSQAVVLRGVEPVQFSSGVDTFVGG